MAMLEVKNIYKDFTIERGILGAGKGVVRALEGVSFCLGEFETLGIVGESGSGKTTLAKIILRLIPSTRGEVVFDSSRIKDLRKDVQIIFQNPYNSLSPKMRIAQILQEPLLIHNIAERKYFSQRIKCLLDMVGLSADILNRYPREFSGGQRQRICIARALACEPKLLVLDEPISSLDLTVQAQMLDLFIKLKGELKLTYIFISHNLAVVRHISDRVLVMHNGRVVEEGESARIFQDPKEAYTKLLLEAAKG